MDVYIRNRRQLRNLAIVTYPCLVLERDSWNDYSYYTTFGIQLWIGDALSDRIDLSGTKIMRRGQREGVEERPFESVPSGSVIPPGELEVVCSLSSADFYERLAQMDMDIARQVLGTLRDAAYSIHIRRSFQSEECFKVSLLRDSSARELLDTAGERFGATGHLVNRFTATILLDGASAPHVFDFDFESSDGLPRRMHSIVGLNGVGKTQVMARLAMLLSRFSRRSSRENRSTLQREGMLEPVPSIYAVVAVSFSAFDEFERPTQLQGEQFQYSYCGLQTTAGRLKTKEELLEDIRGMVASQMTDAHRILLKQVLRNLVRVNDLDSFVDHPEAHAEMYERLSAGQRLALNCICHIVSKIRPRTLILFDEPELHLHPQFVTGLLNSLAEILEDQDSFAIVATHSSLVIQQLPKECVHVIRRDRMTPIVLHPTFQTFGESVSEITRFVFASAESDRDYKAILDRLLLQADGDVDGVRALFSGSISLNADIYLESMRRRGDFS